ncbi:MAG: DNA primase [Oligoflexia bacterium]|nr:DNA primase [Oligoflexia bacterium]
MISQRTIDAVRERANLVEIISETVTLKRAGGGYTGLCPFHGEKTPSFHIRADGSSYHCFGCGVSGNAITFLMQTRGISFPEAIEELALRFNVPIEKERGGNRAEAQNRLPPQLLYEANNQALKFFALSLASADATVKKYLQSRKLTPEAIKAFAIGFSPKSWGAGVGALRGAKIEDEIIHASGLARRNQKGELYDALRGRLIFPVFIDNRRVAGFGGRIIPDLFSADERNEAPKYLNSPESPVYQKSKIFYGLPQALDAIRRTSQIYLVEGYLDVIGMWQHGVKNVLATCGTSVTEAHASRLSRLAKRVRILFDGDAAGRAAAAKCFNIFMNKGLDVHAIFLPEGHDPDTFAAATTGSLDQALEALPTRTLFDCFLDATIARYAEKVEDLGAASKGKIAEELGAVLSKIHNAVEKNELTKRAAFKMNLDLMAFSSMLKGDKKERASEEISSSAEPLPTFSTAKPVAELPILDQRILLSAMAYKEDLCARVLMDTELCRALNPVALLFLSGLLEVLESDEIVSDRKKELIKELLHQFGDSWVNLWKKAYHLKAQHEVDLLKEFDDCRLSARKLLLNRELSELDMRLRGCANEEERTQVSEEHRQVRLRIEGLSAEAR